MLLLVGHFYSAGDNENYLLVPESLIEEFGESENEKSIRRIELDSKITVFCN